uniref:Histidine kinase/HSP90-like ATPase domain-containing protein n=1 Tax=Cercocebus atys TaxID=9531 RepID=A0A2K5KTI6_CERAT
MKALWVLGLCRVLLTFGSVRADDEVDVDGTVEEDLGKSREGSRTDDEVVQREEEAIQVRKVCLPNFPERTDSEALDKIRLISLTDENALSGNEKLTVKIKCDKVKNLLRVTDTGVGMTREELVKNFGTIATSGTNKFLNKMTEAQEDTNKVIVTSKHNNDTQDVWESNSSEYSVIADSRGDTLGWGTTITLVLKEKAFDYLELDTIKNLVKNIHSSSKTETVEEPMKEEAKKEEEGRRRRRGGEKKPKTKNVEKTVCEWELMNDIKPIWQRPSKEVEDEYKAFCKSFSKGSDNTVAYIHFTAEGEVTFKSISFGPTFVPRGLFDEYGSKKSNYIKLYVRCVFITDDFHDMMPKYVNFVKGVVDSDGLPLNVSCKTVQQHKLLKVIRNKLVRKTLHMIKIADEKYNDTFWKEFGTNIKLGVIEDHLNRTRLAKLLRFQFSHHPTDIASLHQYVERMKEKQDKIYLMADPRLLKKGYEVIYLTEPVDEYCIQALPEFDGKRFQNVAKERVKFDESEKTKESHEAVEKEFEPLLNWMKDKALKDKIEKAVVSQCLTESPCALVASQYGWSGNMERIMKAQAYQTGKDISTNYHASQKKTFEINPRHPLIRDLLQRIKEDEDDKTVLDLAVVLFETVMFQSGYLLPDTKAYGHRIERMPRLSLNIDPDAKMEEPKEEPEETTEDAEQDEDKEMDVGTDEEEQETAKESTAEKDEL